MFPAKEAKRKWQKRELPVVLRLEEEWVNLLTTIDLTLNDFVTFLISHNVVWVYLTQSTVFLLIIQRGCIQSIVKWSLKTFWLFGQYTDRRRIVTFTFPKW